MPGSVFFKAAGPIGDTDINALPVKEIGPAVGYYTQCLGFALVSKDRTTAMLKRDDVQIGLAVNGREDTALLEYTFRCFQAVREDRARAPRHRDRTKFHAAARSLMRSARRT